jgi:hypothetical protein
MTNKIDDKKTKPVLWPKLLIIILFIILFFLFDYYRQSIVRPDIASTIQTPIEQQINQKIDCPDMPPIKNNNSLLILAVNLLITSESGKDIALMLTEMNSQSQDQSINDKIKLLTPFVTFNISKLTLFDELNLIQQDVGAPITINPIEFLSAMMQELLSKLITIKQINSQNHDQEIAQIKMAKKYLLDDQLEQAIKFLENIDNQSIKAWISKAKNKQQIDLYVKDIFNSICEQSK